ncbi:MAG: helix-turn-helix domain-containing protein [Oligoflexales bacterium]
MKRDPEIGAIAQALKQILKAKKVTYKTLAERLDVSEQTIKRVLNGDDCSLSRLVEICSSLDVKFFELMQLAGNEQEHSFMLTEDQEQFFVDNPEYYAFFDTIRETQDLEKIKKEHGLTDKSVFRYLKKLDEMNLCELSAGNRFKMKVSGSHVLRPLGPITKIYSRRDTHALVNHLFKVQDSGSLGESVWTMTDTCISKANYKELKTDLHELGKRFRNKTQADRSFYPKEELIDVQWMFMIAKDYKVPPILDRIPNL